MWRVVGPTTCGRWRVVPTSPCVGWLSTRSAYAAVVTTTPLPYPVFRRMRSQYAAEEEQEMSELERREERERRKQKKREELVKGETTFHPLRNILTEELHARASLTVPPSFKASHLVFLTREDPDAFDECLAHISALCHQYNLSPPYAPSVDEVIDTQLRARHYAADFGPFHLKWERHTEFTTYTFIRHSDAPHDKLFDDPVIKWVPYSWRRNIPGSLLCGINVTLESSPPSLYHGNINVETYSNSDSHLRRLSSQFFGGKRVVGGLVYNGLAEAFSDFHIHEDGFQRLLIRDLGGGLSPEAANKLMQQLLDVESYRMMAMLGLPLARKMSPQIHSLHENLYHVTSNLNSAPRTTDKRRILNRMFALSADVDKLISTGLYRFDASAAYYNIFKKRIDDLHEMPSPSGIRPLASFYMRRMAPAMATCEHVDRRLEKLRHALNAPAELLQASINLEQEAQTQKMLESLDRRSHISLRLQETVEGLSVCAISYYSLGLLTYVFEGANSVGLLAGVSTTLATGIAAPFVMFGVWALVRRARKAIIMPNHTEKALFPYQGSSAATTNTSSSANGYHKTHSGSDSNYDSYYRDDTEPDASSASFHASYGNHHHNSNKSNSNNNSKRSSSSSSTNSLGHHHHEGGLI
eukprot:TRINITY_DN1047_c4_g1_i1.p1 TRINITY_DN1047_c4_g1~~TRINITY_DN1047_c4_g1_i1.p1  ORF type:complete len:640 (+),score=95.36 TRINITY_DN1047_c4_g1_i1:57-1976(+)